MTDETLTIRLERRWKKKIEELAEKEKKTKSDIVRKAVIEHIQEEERKDSLRENLAKQYASGDISYDELVKILGYEKARETAFYVHSAERSFKEGLTTSGEE